MAKKRTDAPCAPDRDWQAEDALRTLNRAEEIRKDKKLMADVKRVATKQMEILRAHVEPEKPKGKPVNALMAGARKR